MENWIQEISKTYISSFSPKRKDLVENYVSLNEEQKLELFSQNVHSYLHEQFKNAFGFDMNELSEEDKKSFLSVLFEFKGAIEVAKARGEEAGETRQKRLARAARLAAGVPEGGTWFGRFASVPDAGNPEQDIVTQWTTGGPNNPAQSQIDQIRRERTGYKLDAAQQGNDASNFESRRVQGAGPAREGERRSRAAARDASRRLKDVKERRKKEDDRIAPLFHAG